MCHSVPHRTKESRVEYQMYVCFVRFVKSENSVSMPVFEAHYWLHLSVLDLVSKYGTKKWSLIGSHLDGRTGKQVCMIKNIVLSVS